MRVSSVYLNLFCGNLERAKMGVASGSVMELLEQCGIDGIQVFKSGAKTAAGARFLEQVASGEIFAENEGARELAQETLGETPEPAADAPVVTREPDLSNVRQSGRSSLTTSSIRVNSIDIPDSNSFNSQDVEDMAIALLEAGGPIRPPVLESYLDGGRLRNRPLNPEDGLVLAAARRAREINLEFGENITALVVRSEMSDIDDTIRTNAAIRQQEILSRASRR